MHVKHYTYVKVCKYLSKFVAEIVYIHLNMSNP